MDTVIMINSLEELAKFLNEKGVIEIVMRHKNQKFKTFHHIA